MRKLRLLIASLILCVPCQLIAAQCVTVPEELSISVSQGDFNGIGLSFNLDFAPLATDPSTLYFKLKDYALLGLLPSESQATVSPALDLYIPCITYAGNEYTVYLDKVDNPADPAGHYWKLVEHLDPLVNRKPYASALSLSVDSTTPYIEKQLVGIDPDQDTIRYELISPTSGSGYANAYINPTSGMLYVTLTSGVQNSLAFTYRVTDGNLYSDAAEISIALNSVSEEEKKTGNNEEDAQTYAAFDVSTYSSDLLGAAGETARRPSSIDLSANFPTPANQGRQNSCVGWATAYALKSYHEKIEMSWPLNVSDHLFSPAYLYNQINRGQDRGSLISDALNLAVSQGLATLKTAPYSDTDYVTQPTAAARAEAAKYKAASWAKINDTSQIKAALVNRKPVVVGIDTYAPLYDLQGANSVYNTISGQSRGGHAVTIVGYDDNKYGGAFKVINSWGVNFGDNGYFWMPYSFAPQVLMVAYVLEDADNSGVPDPVPTEPTHPVVDDSLLPNLTVQSWSINYDPRPRGIGTLHYSVVNSGQGIATQGAEVNLMLSRDRNINANDYFVVYEPIPFDLSSGATAYRDVTNAVSFQFPDQLQPGIYYMALWVDDRNVVAESNEGDNISLGDSQANIVSSFSDLKVDTWYTTWDASGHGELTYKVSNVGASSTSSTHWDINLILDSDQIAGNGNEIFLFFESAGGILQPGEYFYRDQYRPASFSLRSDAWGQNVPAGEYYMALWVDDQNREEESNELNNASYSWGTVTLNAARSARSANASSLPDVSVGVGGSAHNGRTLPTENMLVRKVRIGRTAAGEVTVTFPGKKVATPEEQRAIAMKKGMVAQSKLIFPITERIPMPAVTASE